MNDEEEDYRFDSDEEELKKEMAELRDYTTLRSEYEWRLDTRLRSRINQKE